ncbi:Retrotransposon gag protein [Gossypium australe]|uniref:Retrotransposon gag protein n=1 Tax=Gossypium australe TaxID=47621 RepID=A0A5B6VIG0_9ROSI|nr:Retrotransposon gag protein [Gossypium australe]
MSETICFEQLLANSMRGCTGRYFFLFVPLEEDELGIRVATFLMASEGVTTRLQKDMARLQQEIVDIDVKMDGRFKDFQESFKNDIRTEFYYLLEQLLGQPQTLGAANFRQRKDKGILGEPLPGFPRKKPIILSPQSDLGSYSRVSSVECTAKEVKFDCPRFDGLDFLGWWSKLQQYFEAEGIGDQAKVRIVMLHSEENALEWHHFFTQRQGGLHQLSWKLMLKGLRWSLKQCGIVEHFHDQFVSSLNQLHLPESYALSIFISNLRAEIGQYLKLFKPQNLIDGYLIVKQVENVVGNNLRKHMGSSSGVGHYKTLFPNSQEGSVGFAKQHY